MNCRINYIDSAIADKETAKKITDITLSIWNELKDSNLFTFKNSTLTVNKSNTKKRIKQDGFIAELNNKYPNSVQVVGGLVSVNILNNYKEYTTKSQSDTDVRNIIKRDSRFSAVSLSDSLNNQFKPIRDKALVDNDYNLSIEDYDKLLNEFLDTVEGLKFYHVYNNPGGEKVGLYYTENDPNEASWSGWNKSFKESIEGMKRDGIQVFGNIQLPQDISYEGRYKTEILAMGDTNQTNLELFTNLEELKDKLNSVEDLHLINGYHNAVSRITEVNKSSAIEQRRLRRLSDEGLGNKSSETLSNIDTIGNRLYNDPNTSVSLGQLDDSYTYTFDGQDAELLPSLLSDRSALYVYISERIIKSSISNQFNRGLVEYFKKITGKELKFRVENNPKNYSEVSYLNNEIVLNTYYFANLTRDFKQLKGSEFDAFIDTFLSEEIIHAITLNSLSKEAEDTIFNEMSDSLKFKVQNLYGGLLNRTQLVHEYIRQIIQQELFNTVTESQRLPLLVKVREGLNKLIKEIKDYFNKSVFTKKKVSSIVEDIRSNVNKSGKKLYQLNHVDNKDYRELHQVSKNELFAVIQEYMDYEDVPRQYRELFKLIKKEINDDLRIFINPSLGEGAAGLYNPVTRAVVYKYLEIDNNQKLEYIFHELFHAITALKLSSSVLGDKKFDIEITKLREFAKDNLTNPEDFEYELSNNDEFITYAFTSKFFRNVLDQIPYKKTKSVWDYFIHLLGELFGAKDSILKNVIGVTMDMINEEKDYEFKTYKSQTIPRSNEEIVTQLKETLKQSYPEFKLEIIDKLSINGLVDFSSAVVQIKKGRETSLSEEMAHIVVEMHPEKAKFLEIAASTKLYGMVFEEYSHRPEYWKNGKVDLELIKEETAGKLLAEAVYAESSGDWSKFDDWVSDNRKKDFIKLIRQWLAKFLVFIRNTDFDIFKKTAKQILEGNPPRTSMTYNDKILLQIDKQLADSAYDNLKVIYDTVQYMDDTHPLYQESKGKELLANLKQAGNIIRDNLKLVVEDQFKDKIVLPTESIKHAQKLLEKVNVNLDDLAEVSKYFVNTLEGVKNFAVIAQSEVENSDISTILKMNRFVSQWKNYLQNLNEKTKITGELYEYLRGVSGELEELDKKIYNSFKDITTQIFEDHLKVMTEPIRLDRKAQLVAKNHLWADDNLYLWLSRNGKEKWNEIASKQSSNIPIEQKIIQLGKITRGSVESHLDSILANTFDNERLTNIIMGREDDANSIANLFYGASTNRDAIIATFQMIIEDAKVKATDIAREIVEDYMDELLPHIKITGLTGIQIGEKVTYKTKRLVGDTLEDTYAYLNDVDERAYAEKTDRENKLAKLGKGSEEWKKANIEHQKWMRENFYQEYKPSFFERLDDSSDIGIAAKAETTLIWSRIKALQETLDVLPYMVGDEYNPERLLKEDEIEKEYLNYKRLYSEYENGQLKQDDPNNPVSPLKIARYLSDKTRKEGLFVYIEKEGSLKLAFNRFYDEYLSIISPEEYNNPLLKQIKDEINSDTRDLSKIYKLVESLENQSTKEPETKKWIKKNVQRIYTQDFFDDRTEIFNNIKTISEQIDALKGKAPSEAEWGALLGIIKPFKDIDGIVNGGLLSDVELKAIKDFQVELERLKETDSQIVVAEYQQFKTLREELFKEFKKLEELQAKENTPYYNQMLKSFNENIEGDDFLAIINGDNPTNTVLDHVDSVNFYAQAIGVTDPNFIDWFEKNHFQRTYKTEDGDRKKWVPTYAWTETKPKDEKYISYRVAPSHNRKSVHPDFFEDESHKDEFGRWKPREIKYNKDPNVQVPTGFRNEEYYRLKNSNDAKDRALFKILGTLRTEHIKAQFDDGRFINTYKLYNYIPQKERETFEDLSKSAKIWRKRIEQQVQSEGGSNFQSDTTDETVNEVARELNNKGLIGSFFSGMGNKIKGFFSDKTSAKVSVDYQGERIFKPALMLYNHVDIEEISLDVLHSQGKFIEEAKVHQSFNDINPKITIIHKTLKKFQSGERRNEAVTNIVDREVQGINKIYEVGRAFDKVLGWMKTMGTWRSQGIFNPKGAIKNGLAGFGNLWVNKSLVSDADLWKAEMNFKSKYTEIKSQLLGNKPKSKNFKIFEYFMPRLNETYKYYMFDKVRQTFKNGSAFFSTQEEGEFIILGVTLELFLESDYKDGKVKDFIEVNQRANGKLKVSLKNGTEAELRALKLKFAELMRMIQGNQGLQKAKTETSRLTIWSAVMHYRNYLPYTLINRFSTKRTNFFLQEEMEGYYVTFFRTFYHSIKNIRKAHENWADLTDLEKENVWKAAKEMGLIIGAMGVLFLLGYSDWDKDRFKRMKENNYFHNLLIYEVLAGYNEIVGLSPFRGTGFLKEGAANITKTSMAFGEIGKYLKTIDDLALFVIGSESAYVDKNSAFSKKGDVKFIEDIMKILPFNNLSGTFDNAKLVEQTKNYVLSTERN